MTVARFLQQAQALAHGYAQKYIHIATQEAISLPDTSNFLERARELIDRVIAWAKDLFTSKVEGLGDEVTQDDIEDVLSDIAGTVAENLAITEITDVIETTIIDDLITGGIAQIDWICEPGACERCLANAAASPINIDEDFPSADTVPPAHNRCRCHIAPHEE